MLPKKLVKPLFFALFVGSVSGCVTSLPVKGLYVAPSFTYSSLMKEKIEVGGVVSVKRNLLPAHQIALSTLLRSVIASHYPGLNVIPYNRVVLALDSISYESMMQLYRFDGQIPTNFLERIKHKIPQVRYIVFARILHDESSFLRDTSTTLNEPSSQFAYKVAMSIQLNVEVYDLQSMDVVWSGHIVEKKTFKNGYGDTQVSSYRYVNGKKVPVTGLIGKYGEGLASEHQAYPSSNLFTDFMKESFNKIVNKFPKELLNKH